jgi:hypothetical protein
VRARRRAWPIVLIALLAAGCATSGYDAGSLRSRLVDAGVDPARAGCLVTRLEHRLGPQALGSHARARPSDVALVRTLERQCRVTR